ncbi:hypothetical protein [Halorussus halophilus]|uniref:hypothetical protein n=1 Tax=Halorussus halophilus TaxID=2650975 RepID=UPI00130193B2|nr:hypothetical protein [Halorussus halophilus]
MHRRHLLASLAGSALSLSGCLGSEAVGTPTTANDPTTSDDTPTSDDDTSPNEDDEESTSNITPTSESVTVHSLDVRRTIVHRGTHKDPYYEPDVQFVVADASIGERDHLLGFAVEKAFAVVADGEAVDTEVWSPLEPLHSEPAGIQIAFAVPAPLDADGVSLVWTGEVGGGDERRWSFDSTHLDALANPPAFEVRNFEVPDEVERGAVFDVEFTVENVGHADGTFLAELGATVISDTPEVTVDVPKDETVTATRTLSPYYPERADDFTVQLNWGSSSLEQTVDVTQST